ncbi:hypothetical protein LINPERPRIM_LOCUS21140 [Linum perenne]
MASIASFCWLIPISVPSIDVDISDGNILILDASIVYCIDWSNGVYFCCLRKFPRGIKRRRTTSVVIRFRYL